MLWVIVVAMAWMQPTAARAETLTDEQVERALDRMKAYFYAAQDEATGGWPVPSVERSNQRGGPTALVTLALLTAGESSQHPRIARAIEYLRESLMVGTYAVSLRAQVWAALPEHYRPQLLADTQWLLDAADETGRFRYTQDRYGMNNHSTTHYGVLGLWAAARRDAPVPDAYWQRSENYWRSVQQGDGGWGYRERIDTGEQLPSYGSMTAAGLNALLVARQINHRRRMTPEPDLTASINRAHAWLDRQFVGVVNPNNHGHTYYYLHSIERVAMANGVRYINDQDWYREGARHILEQQVQGESAQAGSMGGNLIDTAYAMLFLARARTPVWVAKLQLSDQPWNRRPNDLYFLNQWLSDVREAELNWQVIPVDRPGEQWLSSPLVYLASNQAVSFTEQQKANLKQYLDLGGTLLAVPEEGSGPFIQSIRDLAAELYPGHAMRMLPHDHDMYSALFLLRDGGGERIEGLSNGAREKILLAHSDWSYAFQSESTPGQHNAWRLMANLWVVISDRGLLPGRLATRIVEKDPRVHAVPHTVLRVTPRGKSVIESAGWTAWQRHLHNDHGIELVIREVDVTDLATSTEPLACWTGVYPHALSAEERDAIDAYLATGGTLLIETLGGRGAFASDMESQLSAHFDRGAAQMLSDEPIISGEGIEGGADNRHVAYRRYAVSRMGIGLRPRLAAFYVHDRPSVLVSREDLTLGLMGVEHWGIIGYRPDAARGLMTNILLATRAAE